MYMKDAVINILIPNGIINRNYNNDKLKFRETTPCVIG